MSTSGIHEECEVCGKPRWAHRKEKMCTEIAKTDAVKDLRSAVYCLNLEVHPSIAEDVRQKAEAVIAENATLRAEVERLATDKKVLQSLIEDYQKAVDDSGQHHLIAPENVKERFERLKGQYEGAKTVNADLAIEIAKLKDALPDPVLAERDPESNWYKLRESRRKALLWQQRAEEAEAALARLKGERDALRKSADASHLAASTECSRANKAETALSQAQQALRRIRAELSDPEQSPSETFAKIEAILCGCWSPEPPHDLAKVADKAAGWLCILAEFFQAKSDPARNPHMDWLKLAGKTKEVENELRAAERVNHPNVRVVDVPEVEDASSDKEK